MAELLAIVALREVTLGSVRLHPDHNVAEGRKLENLLRLLRSKEGDLYTPSAPPLTAGR
jgi:hypothetical protein